MKDFLHLKKSLFDLIIFDRNITYRSSNQMLDNFMLSLACCFRAITGSIRKHVSLTFFTQILHYCFAEIQPLFFLTLLAHDSYSRYRFDESFIQLNSALVSSGLFTVIAQAKRSWEFCAGIRRSCIALRFSCAGALLFRALAKIMLSHVTCQHIMLRWQDIPVILSFDLSLNAPRLSASIFFIRQLAPWLSIERVYNTWLDAIRSVFPLVLFDV